MAADPQKKLNVRVLNTTRLSLDNQLFQPVTLIDLASEEVLNAGSGAPAAFTPAAGKADRKSGNYDVVVLGNELEGYSLKEVLKKALLAIEGARPGTLEKLSAIKTTTKRIVSKDPSMLFAAPHLVAKHAEKLDDAWWVGTNNSAQETNAWLKRAADCAGLQWDQDIQTSF